MMKFKKYFLVPVYFTAIIFFQSCGDNGINIFSLEDDVQLGGEVAAEIRNNPQDYPIYQGDPSVKSYITSRIFNHILTSAQIKHKSIYPYQVELIDKPEELNAFALPGGYIYVYTGLLLYLDSEAALAGVLAHEIAHAEARHATKRLTAHYGVSALLSFVLGSNPTDIEQIATNLLVGLAFLANSRSDENESDNLSFSYLRDTRYYPGGVKFFFEHLAADNLISSQPNKVETFLSTHPDPIDRISNINNKLQQAGITIRSYNDTGEGIFRDEYQLNIKSKLN